MDICKRYFSRKMKWLPKAPSVREAARKIAKLKGKNDGKYEMTYICPGEDISSALLNYSFGGDLWVIVRLKGTQSPSSWKRR